MPTDEFSFLLSLAQHGPSAMFTGFLLWAGWRIADKLLDKLVAGVIAAANRIADQIGAQSAALGAQAAAMERLARSMEELAPVRELTSELHQIAQEQRITLNAVAADQRRILAQLETPR